MKRVLLFSVCLMLIASLAFAQAGSIGVFMDPGASTCDLDNSVGQMFVYVFHLHSAGATFCQFKLQVDGMPLTWTHDSSPHATVLGNSHTGVVVGYGTCMVSPIYVLVAGYIGTSSACDMIRVVGHPTWSPPGLWEVNCAFNLVPLTGGAAYINNNGTCPCDIPVEQTNWGRVKAMYIK